jgi:hypothetical protein
MLPNPKSVLTRVRSCLRIFCRGLCSAATPWQKTDYRRWRNNPQAIPSWDDRNRRVAALIPDGSRVIDIGAGAQTLKTYLGGKCRYQPCDLVKSSSDCLLCDFNKNLYPEVAGTYDYVVISGVLEYVKEPRVFLSNTLRYGEATILTYSPWDGTFASKLRRISAGWINHLRSCDLERIFMDLSIQPRQIDVWETHTILLLHLDNGSIPM